jgi:hypothetical protein
MAITTKTPVRTVFDGSNAAIGLAEFQTDEVVPISHGGTSGNSISSAKLALLLTDSNIRSLFSVSGSGSYDNSTGIITVTGGVTSVGGATGTVSNAQIASAITATGTFATLASPTFTGTPLAPTAVAGTSNTMIATTAFVTTAVTNLIDSAPAALDTLNELAAALGDDNNFSATVITQLGNKANTASLTTANVTELTNLYFTTVRANTAIDNKVTKSFVEALNINVPTSRLTGNILSSQIEPTAVTPGVYGSSASVGAFIVDQQGRITSAANYSISIPSSAINTYVALGSQTSGAYVANLVAGTGITLSDLGFEGTTPTISIGQAVATTSNVTFAEINATGNVTSPFFYSQSDINLKKDLVPITDALNIVKSLDGYRFKWKKNDADSFGLIAQHVESVLPMLIGNSPDGSKTVLYNGIIAILIEAIKAQQVQIDEIKAKLNENL